MDGVRAHSFPTVRDPFGDIGNEAQVDLAELDPAVREKVWPGIDFQSFSFLAVQSFSSSCPGRSISL